MVTSAQHGRLMDDIYRHQRLIYDLTRKYYLLGRDDLIRAMDVQPGETVIEVACGTGRNLHKIRRRYPGAYLCGIDISEQMLRTARSTLGPNLPVANADACDFDPRALFGVARVDHLVLSYSLSMIPDWPGALREGISRLSPGGTLHIVDFGDQAQLPDWFKRGLRAWLAKFHVSPRDSLARQLQQVAGPRDTLQITPSHRGYAVRATLTKA